MHKTETLGSNNINILLAIEQPVSLEHAPLLRIRYIGKALNNFGIHTVIIPQQEKFCKVFKRDSRIHKYFRRIYLFFRIIQIIKREKIKYILSRGFYLGLEGIFLAKMFGLKSIFDFAGYVWQEEIHRGHKYKPFLTKILEEFCIKNSDIIITQTESNKRTIRNLNEHVLVIKNGVNLKEFEDSQPQEDILNKYLISRAKPIVGFIGNWENWMKIEDLLNASRYLDNISVVVVGRGRNFTKYRNEFKNIIFAGRIPHKDAMNFLMNFDLCVCPHSKDEIMKHKSAMKTFEYMAAGKPIIVSDVMGKENFLIEEVNCLTYKPEDPRDLADKIEVLLRDDELRNKMGKNNRELVKRFSWNENIEKSGLIEILKNR